MLIYEFIIRFTIYSIMDYKLIQKINELDYFSIHVIKCYKKMCNDIDMCISNDDYIKFSITDNDSLYNESYFINISSKKNNWERNDYKKKIYNALDIYNIPEDKIIIDNYSGIVNVIIELD